MNRSSVKPRKSRNILELYHTSAPPLSQAHSHRHQIKSLWSGCRLNFESIQPVNPTLLANTTVLLPAQPLRKMALPKSCRQALPKSCRRALPKSCRQALSKSLGQALPNRVGRLFQNGADKLCRNHVDRLCKLEIVVSLLNSCKGLN